MIVLYFTVQEEGIILHANVKCYVLQIWDEWKEEVAACREVGKSTLALNIG